MTELTTAPSGAPLEDDDLLLIRKGDEPGAKKLKASEAKEYFVAGVGGGGIEEAPDDGKTYGRKSKAWAEVTGGSGGGGGSSASGLKFRYLRFSNITNYGDGASAREILLKNKGVALPTPTVLSQNASSEYPFVRAFDGVLTNFFSTYGVGTNFVGLLDFGGIVEMDELVWMSRTDSYQQAPARIQLEYSEDNKVFRAVSIMYDLAGWTQGGAARSVSFAGMGGGSGGGSGSGVAPKILQSAMASANVSATAVLPFAPSAGQIIVAICSGFSATKNFPAGFIRLPGSALTNNTVEAAFKIADGTEGVNIQVTANADRCNLSVFVLDKMSEIRHTNPGQQGANWQVGAFAIGGACLAIIALETDPVATFTYDASNKAADVSHFFQNNGGNHNGLTFAVTLAKYETFKGTMSSAQNAPSALYQII